MKTRQDIFRLSRWRVFLALLCVTGVGADAQNADSTAKPAQSEKTAAPSHVTVQVTGGEKDVPVENASVYLKYVEEHKLKDKNYELNVKTNREGIARVPAAPLKRVLIQIIAEGWKTYGRWYDITDPNQVIKIHLEKPPKWY